jgi:sporulation protein YlmC with PRC-barrel domain
MRKELIGAVSALALMTGAAFAQGTSTTDSPATTVNPPSAMEEAPAIGGPTTDTSPMTVTSAEEMLGRDVVGSDGEELGEVEDVIIDPTSGQARQLVISSGGFLGIGEKQIAVDFNRAKVQRGDGGTPIIMLQNVTQADVESMPEFEYSDTMTSLNRNSDTGTSTTTAPSTGAR